MSARRGRAPRPGSEAAACADGVCGRGRRRGSAPGLRLWRSPRSRLTRRGGCGVGVLSVCGAAPGAAPHPVAPEGGSTRERRARRRGSDSGFERRSSGRSCRRSSGRQPVYLSYAPKTEGKQRGEEEVAGIRAAWGRNTVLNLGMDQEWPCASFSATKTPTSSAPSQDPPF